MNGILFRQFLRRFRENALQYSMLLALVAVTIGIIVSLESSAYTIISGRSSHADAECIEDGQFSTLLPLSDSQLTELAHDHGVSLQKNYSVNITEGDIQYRILRPRTQIDMLTLCSGTAPTKDNDVVVEQNFAAVHEIGCGDTLRVGSRVYTVCGTGCVPDYVRPCRLESDMAVTADTFGCIIVSDNEFERLLAGSEGSVEYTYAYRLGSSTDLAAFCHAVYELPVDIALMAESAIAQDGRPELMQTDPAAEQVTLPETAQDSLAQTPNVLSFVEREDNRRMDADLDFAYLYRNAGWIVGVMMIAMLTLVFSIVTRNQIRNEHGAIGSLYALGVSKRTIMKMYIIPGVLIVLLGGALGLAAGYLPAIRNLSVQAFHNENSFPYYECARPLILYLYALLMPPLVDLAVNICVLNRSLSHPVLELLRGTYESVKTPKIHIRNLPFIRTFQLRRLLEERSGFIVFFGVLSSMTLLMLGLSTFAMTNNNEQAVLEHTQYNKLCVIRTMPEDLETCGEKLLLREMKTEFQDFNLTFSLLGMSPDCRFFNIQLQEDENSAVASSALATKLDLQIGDELSFHEGVDEETYTVRITDIIPTGAGLELYFRIDSLRDMLGTTEDYYNAVAFDDEPDLDPEIIYSTTAKDDILRGIDSMRSAIAAFILLSFCSSVLIFAASLYLIVSSMIDRVAGGISLLRVFGYRAEETHRMYTHSMIISVILALLAAIPIAKCFCDWFNPYVYAYMAVGMFFKLPFRYYAAVFGAALLLFLLILRALLGKVRRIPTSIVLKSRE